MGFLEYIEKLRERSASEREQWALSIAIGFTAFLSVIWFFFSVADFSGSAVVEYVPAEAPAAVSADSPLQVLLQAGGQFKDLVGETLGVLGRIEYAPSGTPEGATR